MNSISSERFSFDYNTNRKVRQEDVGPLCTPRRSMKIDQLLNNDAAEESPKAFPLFSSFCGGFQSTTAAANKQMVLNRPITPFHSDISMSRSITPVSQLGRPFTPISQITRTSSIYSASPLTTPLTPISSFNSPPQAPKRSREVDPEPLSFESHTGVLDFRPLNLKLITTTSSESKLLNFDLSPTETSSSFADGSVSSKSVNFYTSRFISNPNLFKNRKFQCRVCDKRFKTTGHLTRHKKIHSGEKKFECSFAGCNSKFSRKDNCMQHYRTHLNGKASKKLKLQILSPSASTSPSASASSDASSSASLSGSSESSEFSYKSTSRPCTPVKKIILHLN